MGTTQKETVVQTARRQLVEDACAISSEERTALEEEGESTSLEETINGDPEMPEVKMAAPEAHENQKKNR